MNIGDPAQIHPFLADIGRDRRGSSDGDADFGATALHLAIRCASCECSRFFGLSDVLRAHEMCLCLQVTP